VHKVKGGKIHQFMSRKDSFSGTVLKNEGVSSVLGQTFFSFAIFGLELFKELGLELCY